MHIARSCHFSATRCVVFLHLRRQRFSQSKLPPRNHVDSHRVPQARDLQLQRRVQRRRLGLPAPHVLELKTQVDAAKVLVDIQHEKCRDDSTQRHRPVVIPHLHRLDVPHQPRIINPLHGLQLQHRCSFFLSRHDVTLAAAKRPTLFPRTAVSRFANAGCPTSLAYWAGLHVWSARGAYLLALPLETRASPGGLPASGNSTPPSGRPNSLWRGSEKETARVPPSLDSPLSAAPETFLLRDAVSAFPIAFGPRPQPLPGARCRVSAARVRWPWRSFWNRAPQLPDRAGRPLPSPTSDSRFRLPSLRHPRHPCACPAGPPRETKIPARLDQAACSKLPSRPRPRPPSESPTLARPPQSSRTARVPASLSPQRS